MKKLKMTLLSVAFVISALTFMSAQTNQTTDINDYNYDIGEPVPYLVLTNYDQRLDFTDLENAVLFYPGDNPDFNDPDYDDSDWTTVTVPSKWETYYPDYEGYAWYRIHIIFPEGLPTEAIAANLGEIALADETYLNGHYIGGEGTMEGKLIHAHEKDRVYQLVPEYIRPGEDNVIAIRVRGIQYIGSGLFRGEYSIDDLNSILLGKLKKEVKHLLLIIAYVVVGMYFILFFLRRPKDKDYLLFGVYTLFLAVYAFLRTDMKFLISDNTVLMTKLEYVFLFPLVPLFTAFIYKFFKEKQKWFHYVMYIWGILGVIASIVYNDLNYWRILNLYVIQPSWLIGFVSIFYVVIKNFKKNYEARIIVLSIFLLLLAALNDILVARGILTTPLLLSYGFFFVVISIALILANRFVRLYNEVEDLNANLEKKVEERTEQVRALVEQQNGDYFLTSLLIKPLMLKDVTGDAVKIDFYVNQKKKFTFRKWEAQLGGDICIANTVRLKGKRYIVFANGDAMGKSMQGAGGALVFGVLFNSIVERTQTTAVDQELSPEEWLNQCYYQLQTVFETFDGSMLISGVVGVLDETSGKLWYFNSEHPQVVLYRSEKSLFLDSSDSMDRKIGTIGFAGIHVQQAQLKPGDILFLGSDGRDDLMLGTDGISGNRIINEDETLFLKHVLSARGDMERTIQAVENAGQLTDDFTLLRVEFLGSSAPSTQSETDSLLADEDNSETSSGGEDILAKREEAVTFYKEGNFKGALHILESIRNNGDHSTLYWLGHSYFKLKQYREALAAWNEALKLNPGHENLKKNIEVLKSKYLNA